MNLGAYTADDIARQLRDDGLLLKTGPFIVNVRSKLKSVADGLHLLYANYETCEPPCFTDYHVSVGRPMNLRRWIRPQAFFLLDEQPVFGPVALDHAFPLLEGGLNWCIYNHSNQYVVIHAAVVERDGRALMLPADPGSGKSTLCAGLSNNGWRLFSDEMGLLSIDDLHVEPIPRPISLKNESIDIMKSLAPDAVFSERYEDTGKGAVAFMRAPEDSIERVHEKARPAWLVFPRFEEWAEVRFEEVSKGKAFLEVADHAVNYDVLGLRGFQALSGLISECRCLRLTFGNLTAAVDALNELASTGNVPGLEP